MTQLSFIFAAQCDGLVHQHFNGTEIKSHFNTNWLHIQWEMALCSSNKVVTFRILNEKSPAT